MAMELCASRAISNLPVFSTVLAGNPQLRPNHALPLRTTLASRSARSLHSRYRHFAISLPRAAASDDSNGSSPLITEERDTVAVLEDSSSAASSVAVEDLPAEKLSSDEVATSDAPKEELIVDEPVVSVEDSPSASSDTVSNSLSASSDIVEDSSSAEKAWDKEVATTGEPKEAPVESAQEQAFEVLNEVATSEEPKEAPVESAQEQAFEVLKDLKLESVDKYSLALYGGGAFFGLWLISAIVGAVDSIPLVPKLLEVVGLGYTVWFAARFLLFKENREELAAKFDEVKEQIIGSD